VLKKIIMFAIVGLIGLVTIIGLKRVPVVKDYVARVDPTDGGLVNKGILFAAVAAIGIAALWLLKKIPGIKTYAAKLDA